MASGVPGSVRPAAKAAGRAGRALSICVFCGARPGRSSPVMEAAHELGTLLGQRGHHLVYGGGGSGLMGVVAWAAFRNGSQLTGVMPSFLHERERGIAAPPQELCLTETVAQRKTVMMARADAFVALPGGYGTLDEVAEVMCHAYLQDERWPLILIDSTGFWRHFRQFIGEIDQHGFVESRQPCLFTVVRSPAEAMERLETTATPRSPEIPSIAADLGRGR